MMMETMEKTKQTKPSEYERLLNVEENKEKEKRRTKISLKVHKINFKKG